MMSFEKKFREFMAGWGVLYPTYAMSGLYARNPDGSLSLTESGVREWRRK